MQWQAGDRRGGDVARPCAMPRPRPRPLVYEEPAAADVVNPRYAGYVRLNRNVLCALGASLAVSAAAAQALGAEQDHMNAAYVLAIDYAVYFSAFGALQYLDNRRRYALPGGSGTDMAALRSDLLKMVSSLGVAEVAYAAVRWILHYNLLAVAGTEPYEASAISQGIATAVYLAVLNLGVRLTRLYGGASSEGEGGRAVAGERGGARPHA